MIRVTTEWRKQRTAHGRTCQDLLEGETEEFDWPDSVASSVVSLLEEHPKLTFSGMEDFGEGECVLTEGHNCNNTRHRKDCRTHHINSVREWIEKRVDEMKVGETEDFTAGGLKWVSVTVEVLPEPKPEDEPQEEAEDAPEDGPEEAQPSPGPAEEQPPADGEARRYPVWFILNNMGRSVERLMEQALELPDVVLTREFVGRTVESALLRIPLPPAVLSRDPATPRLIVRSGGCTVAALREFMREGSEWRLDGTEFQLPDGWAGSTFAELPGRAKTRIREAPLRLYSVGFDVPDDVVTSLARRMTGFPGGGTASA